MTVLAAVMALPLAALLIALAFAALAAREALWNRDRRRHIRAMMVREQVRRATVAGRGESFRVCESIPTSSEHGA